MLRQKEISEQGLSKGNVASAGDVLCDDLSPSTSLPE